MIFPEAQAMEITFYRRSSWIGQIFWNVIFNFQDNSGWSPGEAVWLLRAADNAPQYLTSYPDFLERSNKYTQRRREIWNLFKSETISEILFVETASKGGNRERKLKLFKKKWKCWTEINEGLSTPSFQERSKIFIPRLLLLFKYALQCIVWTL